MDNTDEHISHEVPSDPASYQGRRTSEQGKFVNNNLMINSFNPRSDQYVMSPYITNTFSTRQVMRIKKIIN